MIPTYHISDFPSTTAIPGKFMLETFEGLTRPPDLKWPHKHSFYEIMWLTSGKSINVVDYHQITIEPQMLFFISPGQLHLMNQARQVKGFSITFTYDFLILNTPNSNILQELLFLDNSFTMPYFKLDKKGIRELSPTLEAMQTESLRPDRSPIILNHLLHIFLHSIQRMVSNRIPEAKNPGVVKRYKAFRNLVELNFTEKNHLTFYAEKLFLTPHRINEICKTVTGKTAGEIIRERILLEAKRLLLHSEMSIGEISATLGFEDFSYFSRQFKNKEGVTPAAFRKNMHKKYNH